jgi:hypothetical protein
MLLLHATGVAFLEEDVLGSGHIGRRALRKGSLAETIKKWHLTSQVCEKNGM